MNWQDYKPGGKPEEPPEPGQKKPETTEQTQRRRGRIAWLVGAPVGGLVLGLWIASIPLSVAEDDFRNDASSNATREFQNNPPTETVKERTTVYETVAAPPLGGKPVTPGATSDQSVIAGVCKDKFPSPAQAAQLKACIAGFSK